MKKTIPYLVLFATVCALVYAGGMAGVVSNPMVETDPVWTETGIAGDTTPELGGPLDANGEQISDVSSFVFTTNSIVMTGGSFGGTNSVVFSSLGTNYYIVLD